MHTQMRSSLLLLASLVLLLLATRAHGIRLDRHLQEAINKKQEIMGDSKAEQSPNTARLMTNKQHCTSDGHCNSGKAKRPLVQAEAGAAVKQQQQNQGPERSDYAKQEQEAARQPQEKKTSSTTTTYPDILDIAGMDYSPATRKPPIHN